MKGILTMSVTVRSLYRDTINFCYHQAINIILMAILISFITVLINSIIFPYYSEQMQFIFGTNDPKYFSKSLLEIVPKMSSEQLMLLLYIFVIKFVITLLGHTLMLGGILNLITMVSSGKRGNILLALQSAVLQFPKLLILTFIINLLNNLGLIILIFPGIVLTILLSLSPIVMINEQTSISDAMRISTYMIWKYHKLIIPAIILWLFGKYLVLIFSAFVTHLFIMTISIIILNIIYYVINAVLIIYLYRFYMLCR
ncbi:MAG: YciC family protein [Candidatus Dasytiphilus stammeri]